MTAPTCARPGCDGPRRHDGFCEPDYRYRLATGRGGLRDAGPALERLRLLREVYGWTWQQIAAEAGTGASVPHQVYTGGTRKIRHRTELAILAIPLVPAAESFRSFPAVGTRRRMQALMWMGWPSSVIAGRLGYDQRSLLTLVSRDRVSVRLAQRMRALYGDLSGRRGPSSHAAGKARQPRPGYPGGYAPPAAWDDDEIDDPKARPRGVRRAAAA